MPRVHHQHNPRHEQQSTCGSFWRWRGNCGNRIEGYRRRWFHRLEEPSCPLGLSLSTHQQTLQSHVPGWWNRLGLQPLGVEATEEGDLELGQVVAGIVPMISTFKLPTKKNEKRQSTIIWEKCKNSTRSRIKLNNLHLKSTSCQCIKWKWKITGEITLSLGAVYWDRAKTERLGLFKQLVKPTPPTKPTRLEPLAARFDYSGGRWRVFVF